jgi:hypothetical protein
MGTQQPEQSDLARRIGIAYGAQPILHTEPNRSGLTPIRYPEISYKLSEREKSLEEHQRSCLDGFTSRELEAVGCFTKDEIEPGNLMNDIHKLYQKARWASPAESPFIDSKTPWAGGRLSGHEDRVWQALEPSLRLASRIIYSSDIWLWSVGFCLCILCLIEPIS